MHMGTQIPFKMIDDYYSVWSEWAEILLEEGYHQDSLRIIKHVLFKRKPQGDEDSKKTRNS